MKVVVGIDRTDQYVQALRLLARLRLPNLSLVLVHVRTEPEDDDSILVLRAEVFAQRLGLKGTAFAEVGQPSARLELVARDHRADLIAIGSNESGPVHSVLFGSVGRSLMNEWRGSLLVAKGHVAEQGPVHAVIGYEGTPACEHGVARLISWEPEGLRTANLITVEPALTCELSDRSLGSYGGAVLAQPSAAEQEAIRLRTAGWRATAKTRYGDVVPEIRSVMVQTRADLLILPSRFHTAIDRIVFGSTALAEVVSEHHSVLVIR